MSRTGNTSDYGFVWLTFETRIEEEVNRREGNRQDAKSAKDSRISSLGALGALAVFLSSFTVCTGYFWLIPLLRRWLRAGQRFLR
jgi:hypothetical protein